MSSNMRCMHVRTAHSCIESFGIVIPSGTRYWFAIDERTRPSSGRVGHLAAPAQPQSALSNSGSSETPLLVPLLLVEVPHKGSDCTLCLSSPPTDCDFNVACPSIATLKYTPSSRATSDSIETHTASEQMSVFKINAHRSRRRIFCSEPSDKVCESDYSSPPPVLVSRSTDSRVMVAGPASSKTTQGCLMCTPSSSQ